MIKAEDLMLGNIVLDDHGVPRVVGSLDNSLGHFTIGLVLDGCMRSVGNMRIIEVRGVPITHNILLAIGFVQSGQSYRYIHTNLTAVVYLQDSGNITMRDYGYPEFTMDMSYLHEFQNAIKAFKCDLKINIERVKLAFTQQDIIDYYGSDLSKQVDVIETSNCMFGDVNLTKKESEVLRKAFEKSLKKKPTKPGRK